MALQGDIINQTFRFAEEYHKNDHSGHDFEHIKRVYVNVNKLLDDEPDADAFICRMSALLHDVDDHKLNTDGKVAERFLQSLGLEEEMISVILETIQAIGFSKSGARPNFKTVEMKLLSDADKLDAMGAIGICRALNYGFSCNRPMIEGEFPDLKRQKACTINHFFEKLLLLKGAMQTKTAQKEAQQRHRFMVAFLRQFFAEQNLGNWQNFLDEYLQKQEISEK